MTEKQTEALEKLNRGVQESRKGVQQRTMSLAQDYFGDSAEALKQQINENRAALEGLPDQVPGGREEAFQTLFQELMDNYSAMEQCINEAREDVANLDTDQIRRQGEIEASDAARREARELDVDLTQIEGTGSDGRVIMDDVKDAAEAADNGAAQQAQDAAGQATDQAGQVTGQVTDQAGQVAGQAQDAIGQATGQVGQIADQAGGASEDIDATDAARREAEERGIDLSKVQGTGADGRIVIWDVTEFAPEAEGVADPAGQLQNQAGAVAGQAAQGASDAASQATGQAGQAANQAGEVATQVAGQADGAMGQAGGVANQLADQAVSTTRQTADQAGQTAQQGAGNVADQAGQGNVAQGSPEGPKITKAAQRKAEEMGTDTSQIQGTGVGGLITIKDVVGA